MEMIEKLSTQIWIYEGQHKRSPSVILMNYISYMYMLTNYFENFGYIPKGEMKFQGIPIRRSHDVEVDFELY